MAKITELLSLPLNFVAAAGLINMSYINIFIQIVATDVE